MSLYVNHTLNKLHTFSFCGSLNSWITKQCIALTVLKYKLKILAVEVLGHLLDTSDLKWKIDYSLAISNLDSFPSMNISTSASQSSQLVNRELFKSNKDNDNRKNFTKMSLRSFKLYSYQTTDKVF